MVFALAKILRAIEFLRADDLRAAFGGFFDARVGLGRIFLRVGRATRLDQTEHYRAGILFVVCRFLHVTFVRPNVGAVSLKVN